MMNNREQMMITCRAALSTLAGVDNRTMGEVVQMRMRSVGATAQEKEEAVNDFIGERTAASEDFSF